MFLLNLQKQKPENPIITEDNMDDVPHDIGYVLGNGPSRDRDRKHYDGVTYGCNSIHTEINVDVLV